MRRLTRKIVGVAQGKKRGHSTFVAMGEGEHIAPQRACLEVTDGRLMTCLTRDEFWNTFRRPAVPPRGDRESRIDFNGVVLKRIIAILGDAILPFGFSVVLR